MDTIRYCTLVANAVTKALEEKNISILSAAEQTGIPRTTLIRRLENPEASPLTTRELALLARITEKTASSFLASADSEAE
jgi:ABC-type methionine transport system permease subunit